MMPPTIIRQVSKESVARLTEYPTVSVVIPCRNERAYIKGCIDSFLGCDYPPDKVEVIVADGISNDGTREIVEEYSRRYSNVKLVDNLDRTFPAAINAGIRHSSGDVIVISSAHSFCDSKFVSTCLRYQNQSGADNVGGAVKIEPGADTNLARAIAMALGSRFGSGNAYVKTGSDEPIWADTAAFGCYRRELFDRIGYFDERLLGSSDMDFNRRVLGAGGRILLVPEIVIKYFADATPGAFWRHNFADGVWASYVLKFGRRAFSLRHWIPLMFVASLIGSAALSFVWHSFLWAFLGIGGAYVATDLGASAAIAIRERETKYVLLLPWVFAIRHLAHGLGALLGLCLVAVPGAHWKGRRAARVD
jgi:glycosyltransferase involved in cell wall biosynthesis